MVLANHEDIQVSFNAFQLFLYRCIAVLLYNFQRTECPPQLTESLAIAHPAVSSRISLRGPNHLNHLRDWPSDAEITTLRRFQN